MKPLRGMIRPGMVTGMVLASLNLPTTARPTTRNEAQHPAPGLRKLTSEDSRRADEMDEATALASSRVAPMFQEQRGDHISTSTLAQQAAALHSAGKFAAAQPLLERALEIRRRMLGDDHPDTATSYASLGSNLDAQGKYSQAQPLHEKALAIRRRLLGDDHPDTAASYNSLADNLRSRGRYAEAHPLYEKALAIRRRLLTDDHPDTASSYTNLASNLDSQGKHSQAKPLQEKAQEIRRRLLTDRESPRR